MLKLELKKENGKFVRFTIGDGCGQKLAKKLGKLSKFWKILKSKKLSKSGNLSKFGTKKARLNFLTSGFKEAFNRLWLTFIKAPIFCYLI